jgi:tRNA(Ile)-lysidine synthase
MKIVVDPGTYIVAVSGGVDSVVLLDVLSRRPGLELIVAHFDHGIRNDSKHDRIFVEQLSSTYKLRCVFKEGNLGSKASEATARVARYRFLETLKIDNHADGIITAHHRDDMLETIIINIIRGTGRHGLSSLRSGTSLKRPLLKFSKSQILDYAKIHKLEWHDDSTNQQDNYLRNYIRYHIIPKIPPASQTKLLEIAEDTAVLNDEIDSLIVQVFSSKMGYNKLDRHWFISLPHSVAKDMLVLWLKAVGQENITSRRIEQVTLAAKTLAPGKYIDLDSKHHLVVNKDDLALVVRDR